MLAPLGIQSFSSSVGRAFRHVESVLGGQVKIIVRQKILVKLKRGEYIALEMINVTYNNADIINAEEDMLHRWFRQSGRQYRHSARHNRSAGDACFPQR